MDVELMSRLSAVQPITSKTTQQNSETNRKSFLEELKTQIQKNSYYHEEIAEIIADKIMHNYNSL